MPDDFDIDAFMKDRRKSEPATTQVKTFDVDAFMSERRGGNAKPQSVQPARDAEASLLNYDAFHRAEAERQARKPGLGGNVAIGGERGFRKHIEPALNSIGDVTESMKQGNFRPLIQMGKEALMGTARALAGPPSSQSLTAEVESAKARARSAGVPVASDSMAGVNFDPLGKAARALDPHIAAAQSKREARYATTPEGRRSAQRLTELDARAALDPSWSGKAVRGTTEFLTGAAPTAAAAIASRGAILPTALTAAAQSAGNPSQMGPQAAASVIPTAPIKALQNLRGRTTAPARQPQQQPLFKGAPTGTQSEWPSLWRTVGEPLRVASQAFRTLRTAFDISAPFAQGAPLTRAHPLAGAQAFGKMMRSLSKKQSEAIDNELINHPLRKLGDEHGLYVATGASPEEAYALAALNKVPGISHSERTFRTYLDSLRLSTWESYVKSLRASGASPEAYRQAAAFINIATGRGSLKPGGMVDKAMDLAAVGAFAPRNWIAKFQILDPVRYATLAPGARKIVLRDALVSYGSLAATAALLRESGVSVGVLPWEDDFLTARVGNHRFDLTGGLKTEIKFLAKMLAGTYRQAVGGGNLPGQDPLSVASSYTRGKMAPGPGLVFDALKGSDFKGEKFSEKSKGDIATEFGPMIIEDLREGYKDSGMPGLLKSSPAFVGQRVSAYPDRAKAQWLDEPAGWRNEQKAAGAKRMFIEPHRAEDKSEKDETPAEFAKRKQRVDELLRKHGARLVESKAYQSATWAERTAAREYLRKAIGRDDLNEGLLDPLRIIGVVRESAYQKREKERAKQLRK